MLTAPITFCAPTHAQGREHERIHDPFSIGMSVINDRNETTGGAPSALLSAIRAGTKLKKVDTKEPLSLGSTTTTTTTSATAAATTGKGGMSMQAGLKAAMLARRKNTSVESDDDEQ